MITGAVIFVIVIAMIASGSNGEWGSVAVGAVLVFVAVVMARGWHEDDRAYGNFMEYWANRDVKKERGARPAVKVEHIVKAEPRAKPEADRKQMKTVCHYCGRFVTVSGERVITSDGIMVRYDCPRCGRMNMTKIGA